MALEGLVNEFGPLATTVPMFQEGTWQTSAEIAKERITDIELRDIWLWTANFAMYTVENNEEFLYFGGREANPIFNNIAEAARQLIEEQDYKPTTSEIQAVRDTVQTGQTIRVKLSDLQLQGKDAEWRYFEIDTANWQNMNDAQKLFAGRIYGSMEERIDPKTQQKTSDFAEYMAELKKAGKTTTRVYVLNPEYVKSHVPKDGAIARASRLGSFDDGSDFIASSWIVNFNGALRGVRSVKVAEGDVAQKSGVDNYTQAYNTLLINPDEAVKRITPDIATGLSNLVTTYLRQQKG